MINNQQVLALIPARGGSKGIKDKNIALILGKPLIAYSIESALKSKYIDRTVVSTDSKKIADISKKYGAEIPFLRPKDLARDDTPDFPVFKHCILWLGENENYSPDIIVHLRPTGPLRTAKEIDESIELLLKYPKADSVRSVEEPAKPPYKMWKPEGSYMKPFVKLAGIKDAHTAPRQLLPKVYQTTADIGVCRLSTIISKKSIIGANVVPYILNRPTVDIDTIFDLKIAEVLLFPKKQ
jgi:N-acylneuraminate cytidylyltransferase